MNLIKLKVFYDEVVDSLQRGIEEKVKCENLILEINSSKYTLIKYMHRFLFIMCFVLLDMPIMCL